MLDDSPNSAREIFLEAIEKHRPDEWLNFLKSACNGDALIHRRVASLLKGYRRSGSFMARPATTFLTEIFDLPPEFENPSQTFPEIGRFRLIERIGSGGFGVVFLAEDPVLQRRVAIKIPRPEAVSTADLQRRFVRESQIAAQLMHPHLVSIHEAGQAGSVSYQVTSFCAGGSLASWLRNDQVPTKLAIDHPDTGGSRKTHPFPQRQLPIAVAVELLIGLAEGVHYAHERGILHRDLKPSNILLHPKWELSVRESRTLQPFSSTENLSVPPPESIKEGDSILPGSVPLDQLCRLFQPMISDFGLAKFYDEAEDAATLRTSGETTTPRQTTLMGTPEYMAPEQLNGQLGSIGPATDIYGLGAVLHEVLAGQPVYPHGSFQTIRNSVVRQPPIRLRQLRPEVPRDLEAICLKCLSKSPSQRYTSAKQLGEDLESFLRNQPVTARSWRLHERLFNWTRRRPAVATLSLFAGSLSLGLICFGVWHLYQLNELNFKLVSTIQERELQTSVARHARSVAVDQAKIAQEQSDLAHQQSYRSEELAWIAGQREYAANMWRAADHLQKQQLSLMGVVLQDFIPPSESLSNEVVSIRRSEPSETGETYRISNFAGSEDSRGFEWYYLWNQGINLLDLKGHSDSVIDAALTQDGRDCFSVGSDGTVRRWDAKTARLLQTWTLGEPATHHEARISRDATGAIIARKMPERHVWEVIAWDFLQGQILQRILIREEDFGTIAISPEGTWGVIGSNEIGESGSRRTRIRIWDFESGQFHLVESIESLLPPTQGTRAIAVSPDSQELAICVHSGSYSDPTKLDHRIIRVPMYGIDHRKLEHSETPSKFGECQIVKESEPGIERALTFSRDGQQIAVATHLPPVVEVWNWPERRRIGTMSDLSQSVFTMSFDPKAESLAFGSLLKTEGREKLRAADSVKVLDSFQTEMMIWNLKTNEQQSSGYTAFQQIQTIRFHEPSTTWVVGELSGRLSLWRPESSIPHHDLNGHRPSEAWGLAFAADGKTLYTVGDDARLRAWNMATFEEVGSAHRHKTLISCIAVSPDGRWIATGSYDDDVIIWNAETLSVHAILKGHTHDIRAVAFSSDSQVLASAGRDRVIRLWNVPGATLKGIRESQGGDVRAVGFSAYDQIVEGNADGTIVVWHPAGSSEKVQAISSEVNCLSFAPAGLNWPQATTDDFPLSLPMVKSVTARELVLYGSKFGTFKMMHVPTRQIWMERTHPGVNIRTVAFSPDGRTFGVAGDDNAVHLWHVASRQEIMTFSDLPDSVNQIAFSPDGQVLAAALHNGTVRLWLAPKVADQKISP